MGLILPGVYIEVRPEALIVPGPISTGNIGIVGTAARGPVNNPQTISTLADAKDIFGGYDAFDNPFVANSPLTLVRALEQAYNNGASTIYATRVAPAGLKKPNWGASFLDLASATGTCATLMASAPGKWGDAIKVKIEDVTPATTPSTSKVTLDNGSGEEVYTVKDGNDLVGQLAVQSAFATAVPGPKATEQPKVLASTTLKNGDDAAAGVADFTAGLGALLGSDVQIVVAPGQDSDQMNAALLAHVTEASTDKIKRDRIAIAGSVKASANQKKE